MAKLASNNRQEVEESKTLSKPRIFFGLLFLFLSVVFALSFASYLLNWKANQSQTGAMLDKSIKSSNIFGKVGDWLGNIFIFESINIFIPTFKRRIFMTIAGSYILRSWQLQFYFTVDFCMMRFNDILICTSQPLSTNRETTIAFSFRNTRFL